MTSVTTKPNSSHSGEQSFARWMPRIQSQSRSIAGFRPVPYSASGVNQTQAYDFNH